jgi:hypothetical protein
MELLREEFVARMAQFKYERDAGTKDAPNKPRREEFVGYMERVNYVRDAGMRDVLNVSKRVDFVRSIIECLLLPLKIKMWKRDMSPQQQVEEESLLLLHNQLWLLIYPPFLSGILLRV